MATLRASLKLFSSRTHLFTVAKHLLPFPTTIAAAATTIKPVLDRPPLFPSWTHQHGLLSQVPQVIGGEGKEGKVAAIVETRGWVDDDDDGFRDEHEGGGMSNIDVVEWDESEDHEDDDEEEDDDDDFDFDEDDVNVGDDQKKKLK